MRRRVSFTGKALMRGALWFGWVGGLVTLAVSGSIAGALVFLVGISWLVALVVALAVCLVVLAEGSYRLWDEADRALEGSQQQSRDLRVELEQRPAGGVFVSGNLIEGAQTGISIQHGPTAEETERRRRAAVLARLHQEYLASRDGISPAMLGGTVPLPAAWVNQRLAEMGEQWRQSEYRPGQALPPGGQS